MGIVSDMVGARYGRLVGLSRHGVSPDRAITWLWKCDCGNEKVIVGKSVRRGLTTSCGCHLAEVVKRSDNKHSKHGMTHSRTWNSWSSMRHRCESESASDYARYGGRGITVCAEWSTFEQFFTDMGVRPPGKTLDRIDPNGNYNKNNCKWATPTEQQRNRRSTIRVEYAGELKCPVEWEEATGIRARAIIDRLRAGWVVEKALTTPVRRWSRSKK